MGPIVQEQLNTAINGQADYSSFNIGWDGTVHIGDLSIKDTEGKVVPMCRVRKCRWICWKR